MKKIFFTLFLAVITTAALQAQQISVVSGTNTNLYQTLQEAIENAPAGSVIYLPGGGFQISDDVKITKKLTIIGIGHKANTDNADGNTVISGNIFFNEGSNGSSVMGCYISGNVNIGEGGGSVNNLLIRYCNLNSIQVHDSKCNNNTYNQNYIRNRAYFGSTNATITNNVIHSIDNVLGGNISNNIITSNFGTGSGYPERLTILRCNNSNINNNILLRVPYGYICVGDGNNIDGNMFIGATWGDNCVSLSDVSWNDIFINHNDGAVTPASNFHFKDDYKQYESKVGIYAGTGFKDSGMAPVPYIVAKQVDEKTDASGMLNVKIRVKAGE